MNEIAIHMKLFGTFRKFGDVLDFTVPAGSTASFVKKMMSNILSGGESSLVFDSVLADDNAVLPDTHVFKTDARLSILPPVCGG
ncbi:MAG: hypothetical protein DHS20C02_11700 [Micavibrio sp.]|nr:MAG: hypothetical protein DHS20C02_11700 [Micavibrio sp.]